jgi:hypothetical protein
MGTGLVSRQGGGELISPRSLAPWRDAQAPPRSRRRRGAALSWRTGRALSSAAPPCSRRPVGGRRSTPAATLTHGRAPRQSRGSGAARRRPQRAQNREVVGVLLQPQPQPSPTGVYASALGVQTPNVAPPLRWGLRSSWPTTGFLVNHVSGSNSVVYRLGYT